MLRRVVVAASHDIAVVAGTLFGMREDAVGFAYAHEALGCVGIARVVVWVVGFGEGVEGSGSVWSVTMGTERRTNM